MKKFLILITLLLIIFIPSNVFADSYTIWKVPYKNNSYSSYDSFYGYYGTSTSNLHGATEYTSSFYYQSTTFEKNKFDYVEIPITIYIDATGTGANMGDSSFYTIPNADTMYYIVNNIMLNVSITYSNSQYDAHSDCEVIPNNYNGNNITGIAKCPVNRVADGIRYVSLKHTYQGISASSYYTIFFGSTGWLNFLYKGDDSSSIASAITSQTTNITNAQNQTTNAINNIGDDLTDSSTNSDSDNTSAINNFNSKLASNSTIQSLVTMPITFFQNMLNSVSGTCTPFSLGTLFGTAISLPCVDLESILGSTLWGIIDVLCSGFFIYNISSKFKNIFHNLTSLKDVRDEVGN